VPTRRFERLAAVATVAAAVCGILYSITFVALDEDAGVPATFLLLAGVLALAVLVALYQRLRAVDESLALLALLLGTIGATGSIVHGGYDLANAVEEPTGAVPDLPNAVDPRGLLTFGAFALAFALFGWLMAETPPFPRLLARLAFVLAVFLLVLYLARLIVVDSDDPVVAVPAVITGLGLYPLWYGWLALVFWRGGGEARGET
jgi:hypothetical protein